MTMTHIEFASDVADSTCPDCLRDTAREAMLVNGYGLVLAHGTSCVHCGHQRRRVAHVRHEVRRHVSGRPVPRVA